MQGDSLENTPGVNFSNIIQTYTLIFRPRNPPQNGSNDKGRKAEIQEEYLPSYSAEEMRKQVEEHKLHNLLTLHT